MSEYIVELDGELGMALAVACAGAGFAREEIVRCRDCKYLDDREAERWDSTLAEIYGEPPVYCELKEVDA